jgi:hypothetical protein
MFGRIFNTPNGLIDYEAAPVISTMNPYEGSPLECLTLPPEARFDVITLPTSEVLNEEYQVPKNARVVINEESKQIFGFVTTQYKVLLDQDIINVIPEAIMAAGIDVQGMSAKFDFSNDFGKMNLKVNFPSVTIEPKVGDIASYGLEINNSYNATLMYSSTTYALRWKCMNGWKGMESTNSTRLKHTNSISIEGEAQKIVNGIEAFHESEGVYARWMAMPVSHYAADELFSKTLAQYKMGKVTKVNRKTLDHLNRQNAKAERTLWGVYNVATAWATHLEGHTNRGGWQPQTQATRHSAISQMMRHDIWKELENA